MLLVVAAGVLPHAVNTSAVIRNRLTTSQVRFENIILLQEIEQLVFKKRKTGSKLTLLTSPPFLAEVAIFVELREWCKPGFILLEETIPNIVHVQLVYTT